MLGVIDTSAQVSNIPLPRPVIEWCLECQSTVTLLYKVIDNKDSSLINKNEIIIRLYSEIDKYKQDSTNYTSTIDDYSTIIANKNTVIDLKDKQLKKKSVNKWLERTLFVGAITAIVLIKTKEDD